MRTRRTRTKRHSAIIFKTKSIVYLSTKHTFRLEYFFEMNALLDEIINERKKYLFNAMQFLHAHDSLSIQLLHPKITKSRCILHEAPTSCEQRIRTEIFVNTTDLSYTQFTYRRSLHKDVQDYDIFDFAITRSPTSAHETKEQCKYSVCGSGSCRSRRSSSRSSCTVMDRAAVRMQ